MIVALLTRFGICMLRNFERQEGAICSSDDGLDIGIPNPTMDLDLSLLLDCLLCCVSGEPALGVTGVIISDAGGRAGDPDLGVPNLGVPRKLLLVLVGVFGCVCMVKNSSSDIAMESDLI